MARDDDDFDGRRGFPVRTFFAATLFLAAAVGAGYYAWLLREENESIKETKTHADWDRAGCARELDEAKRRMADVTLREETCTKERGELAQRQKEIDEQVARVESNLSATKGELEDLRKQRAEAESRYAQFREIAMRFREMVDTGKLQVVSRKGNMVVQLPSEVLFPSASADLSKEGELAVLEVGLVLKQFPGRRFMVVGHTDSVPVKSSGYVSNWELSTARAVTVTRFLIQAGMKPDNLVAAGAAEFDPIADNKGASGRQKNRRIEIVALPDIKELPDVPLDEPKADAKADDKGGDKKDEKKDDKKDDKKDK